ncbi:MAG: UvrD-helicase domain-containing protein, partial [Planctomycetota bacterium]|nr:UvrD-helicase domain-containing protein [Planctomycetota bacterium]
SQQLTASQRKAVFHVEGPLLVIAGPGSGKTRVITYRIAALIDSGVLPRNICAITFTNKAADEMRQRAIALGASAGAHISTFHSLCVRILRQYADNAGINSNFSIYDEPDQARCIKQAVKDCELDTTNFSPAGMLEAISTLKNGLIDVDRFKSNAEDFFSKTLAKIYARYQHILTEHNALDFDDLLMKTAFLLQNCSDVCSRLADRFKFLLIDEYQDTNRAQYIIAKTLASQHNNICATGDPDQSIYRWRGADIRNILDFESDWPDATIVKLEENFRSTANILELADNLISFNRKRKEKKLIPTKPSGKDIAVSVCEDEIEEAETVAGRIKELTEQGASLKNMAVFYRVNAMSRLLEEAFIRNKIPYQVVRGVEFYSRKEIRDVLAYLKVLVNPSNEIALLRIINTPARGIGKTTIDKVRAYATKNRIGFFEAIKKAERIDSLSEGTRSKLVAFANMLEKFKKDIAGKVAPLAERIFTESGLAESLRTAGTEGQEAQENIKELINAAAWYDQQTELANGESLVDYLQQISLFSDADGYDTSSDRVALMTLHAAKGLEFENVFIVGVEDGLLPHAKTDTYKDEDELEEERRLFFVGITRAKTGLYISYARYRTLRGQMLRTIPSQFLFELGIDLTETAQENLPRFVETDDSIAATPHFTAGQRVRHKFFGRGRVKEFIDMGENSVVVVEFNTGQTKSLMVKYADLSII